MASRLLAAATEELIVGGGAFEILAVAKRAGAAAGSVYHHFDSKNGLIKALISAFYDELEESVLSARLSGFGSWGKRERERLRRYLAFHYQHPLAGLVLGSLARESVVAAAEAERLHQQITAGTLNLDLAKAAGVIPSDYDTELLAATILGGVRAATARVLQRPQRPAIQLLTDQLWQFISACVGLCDHQSHMGEGAKRD